MAYGNSPGGSFLDMMTKELPGETIDTLGAAPDQMIRDVREWTIDLLYPGR